jgi:hypothetical protein
MAYIPRFIVLENGQPAIIPNSKYEIWKRCIFTTDEEAINYAIIWCGRMIEGRPAYTLKDWIEGINISQTEDECIVTISNILVP